MLCTNPEIEHKWRDKANAVPEARRGRDLKGLLYQYDIMDSLDGILQKHQRPFTNLPEELQTKLMVSLLHAYLVAYEELHLAEDGGLDLSIPSDAGLHNLPVTPCSLLKASLAALFYQVLHMSELVLLTSGTVTRGEEMLALLQYQEPQFGITELLWVLASLRARAAFELNRTADSHLRGALGPKAQAAGMDMLRTKPDMPVGHAVLGHVLMMGGDLASARMILEQGIQVADQTSSQWHACLLRFELAQALLTGADGRTFKKGDVQKLVSEGDAMHKQLRKWKHPAFMNVLLDYQYRVHQLLKQCPGYQTSPDDMRLPASCSICGIELRQGPSYGVCGGCGSLFPQLWKCKACKSIRYCSTQCQTAHWKEHKQECRRIQQDRATKADA
ncbi:hypothetical protein WJX72_005573 [[Myrmecia] bisecta]|uniref:MYND-type domain-containing protein n=1 Tax=[Myrmecia] bisecta TaxID=41462 RepID=A0AAW1R5W6_9CHLO